MINFLRNAAVFIVTMVVFIAYIALLEHFKIPELWQMFIVIFTIAGGIFITLAISNYQTRKAFKFPSRFDEYLALCKGNKIRIDVLQDDIMLKREHTTLLQLAKAIRQLHHATMQLKEISDARNVKNFQELTQLAQNISMRNRMMGVYSLAKKRYKNNAQIVANNKKLVYI